MLRLRSPRLRARNRPGARQCAGSCRTWLRLCLFLGFTTGHPLALALPLQHGGLEHPAVMPPEPPISERCAIVGLAHTEADEEPALVVVHTPFLGLGAGHARQVGLPADVIDQYRAAPAGLLLVACAHHGRALAGMVQEHDRAPGIGGDGLHATDDLGHGAAGVFFLDVEPAQRVQHHQAAALGGALEAVEPLRGHDVGQAADQRLDQQAVSHGLPFLGAEVRPKGVQAVMNGGGRVFGGQVDHRAGGQFAHLQQIRPACNLCGQLQGQHGFTGTTGRHQRPDRTGHHVGQNVVQRWRRCCERLQNIDRLMGSH
uniref:Replication protein repA n=1 Tax=Klebsiella pneumoniae TaxID=573 RepID=A0A411KXG3_KLEPN|nr:replication protein repA [Klebsiella pneumoniae]